MRNMHKLMKNRLALSTVITTLIILVVSVLLAGVVTYFAINVVSTRVQQESLKVSCPSVWVSAAGKSQAALVITNAGGRDVVISGIQIRGITVTVAGIGAATAAPATLIPYATIIGATPTNTAALAAPSGTLTLASGGIMVVYIADPTGVGVNDIGSTIGLTVFTSQAMYYQETNVQATTVVLT